MRAHVKAVADEAETLTEASLMLRDLAEWLLELLMLNADPERKAYERDQRLPPRR